MTKKVSLEVQRKLVWIPIVNISIFPIFLYNCVKSENSTGLFLRGLFPAFAIVIAYALMVFLLSSTVVQSQSGQTTMLYITEYILPLLLGLYLIRFQKKHCKWI